MGLRRRSLRATIVGSVLATFAVLLLLSGTFTVLALQRSLVGQLDRDLELASARDLALVQQYAERPGWTQELGPEGGPGEGPDVLRAAPGGAGRSLNLVLSTEESGAVEVLRNSVVTADNTTGSLADEQLAEVLEQAEDSQVGEGRPQVFRTTMDLGPDIGEYRVQVVELGGTPAGAQGQTSVVTGLPLSGVAATTRQAVWILVPTGLLTLALAGVGSAYLVRRNLAPLDRVAATARRVSEQQLARGEVAVADRVRPDDTDPATEVGQVGLALNNLLDTMEAALSARHASEQRVRQFVADASHELRTPLASIRGYAELSRRETEPVPEPVRHALHRVESESLRMQGLVEDLLLLARLDAGRPLERDEVDLTLACLDAVGDARVAGPGHVWALELPDEPVEVVGDEARLRQVLGNLLTNARTHTPGGTTVTTRLRRHGGTVELVVADDGPGVPEPLRPTVFERFARGDDSRSRAAGSTGLGLSIVSAVVRAHGGGVRVESEPGRTAFVVQLPAGGPP